MSVTIGADPEFFLKESGLADKEDSRRNLSRQYSRTIPSIGIVSGSKHEPYDLGNGLMCHEDNVLVEIGFPPTNCPIQFTRHVLEAKVRVRDQFLTENQSLSERTQFSFQPGDLDGKPQAWEFGCEPDFMGYEAGAVRKRPPILEANKYNRTAAGHIHIGGDFNCPPFIAALFSDIFLTIMQVESTWYVHPINTPERRSWYGKAGVFRTKPYGIEYRTPSNFWTRREESMIWMGTSALALGVFLEETSATRLRGMVKHLPWKDIRACIDNPSPAVSAARDAMRHILSTVRDVGVPV